MAKLKGSTIIEVLVAMVIILACSTVATVIYTNILQSQNTSEKLRAYWTLKQLQQETQQKSLYINEEMEADAFNIKKECRLYENNPAMILVTFTIKNKNNKLLIRQSKIILDQ